MSGIGVVGLGIMGGAIARHLAAAGLAVIGYDIEPGACERARAAGVRIADSLEALVAEGEGPIILSLASAAAVLAVGKAIAATAGGPRAVVEMSTLELSDKLALQRLLEAAGHLALDCPISGTGAQMAVKDVVVYASGDADAVQTLSPLFERFARQTIDLGAFGNGTRMKLVANHLVAIHNVATAEAMRLGVAAGLAPHALIEGIRAGAGNSRIFELRAPLIADGRFSPATMKLSVWTKDMAAIDAFAQEVGVATPLLDTAAPLYDAALERGLGELDTAAVALAFPDRE